MLKRFIFLCATLLLSNVCPLEAKTLDLSEYHGKVVYVDFWASWCGPCRKSFPAMNRLTEKYSDNDFILIAVNEDNDPNEADKFLKNYPANFKVIYDPQGDIAKQFQVQAMPSTYIFNKEGVAKYLHKGFRQKDIEVLQQHIESLLAQPPSVTQQNTTDGK